MEEENKHKTLHISPKISEYHSASITVLLTPYWLLKENTLRERLKTKTPEEDRWSKKTRIFGMPKGKHEYVWEHWVVQRTVVYAWLTRTKVNVKGCQSARNKINVIIVQSGAGEKGSVRVKCCAHYWRGAVVLQETAIRLIGGEGSTVHIESFDFVTVCATAEILGWNPLNL